MKIRFIIEKIEKLKTFEAIGTIYFINNIGQEIFTYKAVSGGWGNGPLETGLYNITSVIRPAEMYKREDKDSYTLFNIGGIS